MSYNQKLEDQIDHHFIDREDMIKKKQMGGVGWLIRGNMCCGIYENLLIIRTEPTLADALIKKPGIHLFGHRQGDEDSIISIDEDIYSHPRALRKFIRHALDYTGKLPAKTKAEQPARK